MKLTKKVLDELRVEPGSSAHLERRSTAHPQTDWLHAGSGDQSDSSRKLLAHEDLAQFVSELEAAQERLWASGTHALLIVMQALDAAGKDGTIKHVMSGVNPQGCRVVAFKQPSPIEAAHDFLWRASAALPSHGEIAIFNRSYYEDVLVVRVHPERLPQRHGDAGASEPQHFWEHRFEDINAFEHHLHRNNTRIVKIFLHLSRDEQRRRFLDRLDDPDKRWKFSTGDLVERGFWDEYQSAYEEAITQTSTPWAPWYVVPADHKYELRALVGGIVVDAIDQLDLRPPAVDPSETGALDDARRTLMSES